MALSKSLISQFAKVTNDNTKPKKESTMYATVPVLDEVTGTLWVDGKDTGVEPSTEPTDIYVHIDGAYDSAGNPTLTLVNTTVRTAANDRVIVSIRNHMAVISGNLTTPSTTVQHVTVVEETVTDEITATNGRIDSLSADNITTTTLNAGSANIEYLTIQEYLDANYANIGNLQTVYAGFKEAYAKEFSADEADIKNLIAYVADINKLMFGSASGDSMHTSFANAVVALIGDAQIKSAMIESLDAEKITSGSINTKKVKVVSDDGSLVIFDNLIQIKEGENVRVQIGKDASDNYSIAICDADGLTMFDINGITKDAIKTAIIVNDMVADDANISGKKLDIESLITEINDNGSTTIKSSKIKFDDSNQTLDVAFKTMSETVTSQGTSITANSEAIENKVWQQDIDAIKLGGRNLLKNSRHIPLISNNSAKYPITSTLMTENGKEFYRYVRTSPELTPDTMSTFSTIPASRLTERLTGKEVTFSFLMRCSHETVISIMGLLIDKTDEANGDEQENFGVNSLSVPVGTTWQRISVTEHIDLDYEYNDTNILRFNPNRVDIPDGEIENFYMDVCEWKVELGNKATDWTPAPEDVDVDISDLSTKYSEVKQNVDGITTTVADHSTRINDTDVELTAVQSVIGQLTDSISMLVTDGNGTSLMTQTDDGWTFSTSSIQNAVDRTSESLAELIEQCGNTDAAVEVLTNAVADLGVMADYIKIGTYEDEPCIELGESDSNFKLMITNTRIMFMDGSDIPAYISNKSLHIKKAVIEEELHQGGFSWVTRSNGHLSLIWKGVTE